MRTWIAAVLSLWLSVGSAWSAEALVPAPLPVDTQPADAASATSDPPAPDRPASPATEPAVPPPNAKGGWMAVLAPGQRIRLTTPGGPRFRFEAWFVDADDEGMSVRLSGREDLVRVDWSRVTRLERYAGSRSGARKGAQVGLLGLGLPSAISALLMGPVICSSNCDATISLTVVVSLVSGAALGALVGSAFRTSRWERVPERRLRITVATRRRGVAVGLALGF